MSVGEAPATAAGTEAATPTKHFRVFRYKRGDAESRFDGFDVPVGPTTTVLESLRWIQLHVDPSLALRHSCFHASCGTCGLRVNGREVLGCVTMVHDLGSIVTVEPIANIPVLTDLVVDMDEFYARFPASLGATRSSGFLPDAEPPDGIEAYTRFEDCIECGLCLSACPVSATSEDYVGPAALAAAQRLLEEPRGTDPERILDWADDPVGAWRCHAAFECTEACPSGVEPAARIMALRGILVGGALRLTEGTQA
ncbi:MAG: succinate dehydrogenase/fumarate reductase iron-sulfur subunit [Actinomycetota bacterium]